MGRGRFFHIIVQVVAIRRMSTVVNDSSGSFPWREPPQVSHTFIHRLSDGEVLLPSGQVFLVKGIGLFCRRESGIYNGFTSIPSGVSQLRLSMGFPFNSFSTCFSQAKISACKFSVLLGCDLSTNAWVIIYP